MAFSKEVGSSWQWVAGQEMVVLALMMLLCFILVRVRLPFIPALIHPAQAHGLWLVYSSMDDPLADVA